MIRTMTRRTLLQALGIAAVGAPISALAQGRCMRTFGIPSCNTGTITPVFEPTGWKTVALDHITFNVADYRKEAAFYIAIMRWKLRSDDAKQAVLDLGDWGSVIFKESPAATRATVESFCFGIEPWNAKTVETELRKRGLAPVAERGGDGFESFHVKDPDGFSLQISNGAFAKNRKAHPATAKLAAPEPFASTGWKTV